MVQVLISPLFLSYFEKFEDYKMSDFNSPSSEIDFDSYAFIRTLLYTNKAEWVLNISAKKLESYKSAEKDYPKDEELIANLIRFSSGNVIRFNTELYEKICQSRFDEIDRKELPPYVFLGEVTIEQCNLIAEELGIVVLSKNKLKLKDNEKGVQFFQIGDTKERLFNKLLQINFHSLEIEDQYFSKNYQAVLRTTSPFIDKKSLRELKVLTNNSNGGFKLEPQEAHLKEVFTSNCGVQLENGAKHDRFLKTNTYFITLGNSLFQNGKSTYTQFPIGIYKSMFEEN